MSGGKQIVDPVWVVRWGPEEVEVDYRTSDAGYATFDTRKAAYDKFTSMAAAGRVATVWYRPGYTIPGFRQVDMHAPR